MFIRLFFFVCFTTVSLAQTVDWIKQIGGEGHQYASNIITDADGNTYTSGKFQGTIDFDPGPGVFTLTGEDPDTDNDAFIDNDAFLTKFDANGNFLWAKHYYINYGNVMKLAVDEEGNLYATTRFANNITFETPAGDVTFNFAEGAVFILKLTASGEFVWVKQIGSTYDIEVSDILIDNNGSIVIGGYFGKTADFDPGNGTETRTPNGAYNDAYLLKLSTDCEFVSVLTFGGTSYDLIEQLTIDQDGNIYATGRFGGETDFDPSSGVYNIAVDDPDFGAVFISKIAENGDLIWAKAIQGGENVPTDFVADSEGNVYVAGQFVGTIDADPNAGVHSLTSTGPETRFDIYFIKLDESGEFRWALEMGDRYHDYDPAVSVDSEGYIYLTGIFENAVTIGSHTLTSLEQSTDAFIAKLSSDKEVVWVKQVGGNGYDYLSATVLNTQTIYFVGSFMGEVNFNTPQSPVVLTSQQDDSDMFIGKLYHELTTDIAEEQAANTTLLYPNPSVSGQVLQLHTTLPIDQITIYNAWGRTIYTGTALPAIDTPGMYVIELEQGGKRVTQSFVVQ